MPDPQNSVGLLLPCLPRCEEFEAESSLISRQWQARRSSEGKRNKERRCAVIYKRGRVYWYKFVWDGTTVRETTRQTNDKLARNMEAAHRTRLAKQRDEQKVRSEQPGCSRAELAQCTECEKWYDRKQSVAASDGHLVCSDACHDASDRRSRTIPTLRNFCEERFEPWAKATFEDTCLNNWYWFRAGTRRLKAYPAIADCRLDRITNESIAGFATHEKTRSQNRGRDKDDGRRGLAVSSINSTIRVLRRILRLAVEWGVIDVAPKLVLLPGERRRERVITREEEALYLAAAPPRLADVATVLVDTGLRPDECYRLRWENISWTNARNGSLLVTHGKTPSARRMIPMTSRVKAVLEMRWENANRPQESWVWPAPTLSGHITHASLKKPHTRTFRTINAAVKQDETKPEQRIRTHEKSEPARQRIRPFILYAFRHTFLTRLGESGCDAWTLARIAGHSSISISSRYVHPSDDIVADAMARLGGHKIGHNTQTRQLDDRKDEPEVKQTEEEFWRARRDSNSRPIAPEAIALSS